MSDTTHLTHQLSEYLDHALPAPEQRAVEKHLEQCRECSGRYKELQHLRQRLKAAPTLTPPESFYRGVLERIEQDKKPFLIWDWPAATKAVATFGVLMVVVMVAREARRSQPELFAPVAPAVTSETAPVASTPTLVNSAPVPASEAMHAEPPAFEKKMDATNAKSPMPINEPVALKQKETRQAAVVSKTAPADEEREKSANQLRPAAPLQANFGMTDKNAALAATPMDTAARKVTLQARDTKGDATQDSFSGEQQQLPAKKELSAALSTEWKGASSAISSFHTVVITTDADWKALWAEHTQNQVPPPPVPEVDFSRFIVVGVFAGTRPDLQAIAIQDIQTASDATTVLYKEVPVSSAIGSAASTQNPYDLKRISKAALPITFTKTP